MLRLWASLAESITDCLCRNTAGIYQRYTPTPFCHFVRNLLTPHHPVISPAIY